MPLILQWPAHFIYTMLPSKDDDAVHASQVDHEEDLNADEALGPPKLRQT